MIKILKGFTLALTLVTLVASLVKLLSYSYDNAGHFIIGLVIYLLITAFSVGLLKSFIEE